MKRLSLLQLCALFALVSCDSPSLTSTTKEPQSLTGSAVNAVPRPTFDVTATDHGAITAVLPSTLTIAGTISFADLSNDLTNHNGILDRDGAALAERFAGQVLTTTEDNFDVLSGSPSSALTLQAGASGQNLVTFFENGRKAVAGLGPTGFSRADAIGEGAMAVLFDEDQFELGFSSGVDNGGTATVSFFKRDGSLIETLTIALTSNPTGDNTFAFRRAGSVKDIAGFSIYNDDPGGTAYHSFRIAEPTSTTKRVENGEAATITVKENGKPVAGIDIPAGTFDANEDVDVTVRLLESPCHDFLIGQGNRCIEITAKNVSDGQDATLHTSPIVGFCLATTAGDREKLDIFKFDAPEGATPGPSDARQARPFALREANADFLDCSDFEIVRAAPRNWLEGLAMGAARRVERWITPKSLWAADGGFGGFVDDGHMSIFTWAPAIPLSHASVAVNVKNSGKDAFGVTGTFDLGPKTFSPFLGEAGFDPAAHDVTVGFGSFAETIPAGSFKLNKSTGRYVYKKPGASTSGVVVMEIDPTDGSFGVSGNTPTQGALPNFKSFNLQIGHRARGAGIYCGATGSCPKAH